MDALPPNVFLGGASLRDAVAPGGIGFKAWMFWHQGGDPAARRAAPVLIRCAICARRFPVRAEDFDPRFGVSLGPTAGGTPLGHIFSVRHYSDGDLPGSPPEWYRAFSWMWHVGAASPGQWMKERRSAEAAGVPPPQRRLPAYMDAAEAPGWYTDRVPGMRTDSQYVSVECSTTCTSVELRCHRCKARSRRRVPVQTMAAIADSARQFGAWYASFAAKGLLHEDPAMPRMRPGIYGSPELTVWFDGASSVPFSLQPPTEDLGRLLRWPWAPFEDLVPLDAWEGHAGR